MAVPFCIIKKYSYSLVVPFAMTPMAFLFVNARLVYIFTGLKNIDYCISNDIGNLVVGYNETFQKGLTSVSKITRILSIFRMVSFVKSSSICVN